MEKNLDFKKQQTTPCEIIDRHKIMSSTAPDFGRDFGTRAPDPPRGPPHKIRERDVKKNGIRD